MVEVFTIGGGEYIVNVFNAVAAWTGGGGYRALLRVVMVLGFIYALMAVAFTMNVRAWLNWFLGSSLIYSCLMVPTVTVKVTIDPTLLGGLVVKMGSRMVDASLKTKLNSIRLAMKEVG